MGPTPHSMLLAFLVFIYTFFQHYSTILWHSYLFGGEGAISPPAEVSTPVIVIKIK